MSLLNINFLYLFCVLSIFIWYTATVSVKRDGNCHCCATPWASVLVSKADSMILKPKTHPIIIYILNFFLSFTRKHPFGKSAHLIGEIFCLGSPEIQSCLVAFPNFYDAKYAYIPYLQAAYVSSGTFDPTIYQPKYINL